jgi:hypothetical protein
MLLGQGRLKARKTPLDWRRKQLSKNELRLVFR